MRSFFQPALVIFGLLTASAVALAVAPAPSFAGNYVNCVQPAGVAWRLTASKTGYAVDYRDSSLEDWQSSKEVASPLSEKALADLNATGSSHDPKDQATAALVWDNAHFLRLPPGWFDRYRSTGQNFTPELVLTGGGFGVFLCRSP